jgi:hypothetical protein
VTIPPTGPFQFDPGGGENELTFMTGAVTPQSIADEPPAAVPAAKLAKTKQPAQKLSVDDILVRARERLAELKLELEEMSKLQVEHDKLERLLAAADALDS